MSFQSFHDFVLLESIDIIIANFDDLNEKQQPFDIDDESLNEPIAIYVPTFNIADNNRGRGKHIEWKKMLGDMIDSLKNQTYKNWKLFIVGDNFEPEDDLKDFLKDKLKPSQYVFWNAPEPYERGKVDPSVLRNSGGAGANNKAIDMARKEGYEFFAHIDHDDVWKPEHLESMMKAFQQDNDIAFGYHRASRARHKGGGKGVYYWGAEQPKATLYTDEIESKIIEAPHSGIFWHGPSVGWPKYRTVPQQRSEAPKRNRVMGGDEDFIRQCIDGLIKNKKKAVYVPKLLVRLRNSVGKLP